MVRILQVVIQNYFACKAFACKNYFKHFNAILGDIFRHLKDKLFLQRSYVKVHKGNTARSQYI